MDYGRIYREFIADRRAREPFLQGYTERHHILPRARGGGNEAQNLICLTPEDHFFAHLLLAHIYGGSMWSPVFFMAKHCRKKKGKLRRQLYAWAVRKASKKANAGVAAYQYKPEVYRLIHKDGRQWAGTMMEMYTTLGLSKSCASMLTRKSIKSSKGWHIEGTENPGRSGPAHWNYKREKKQYRHIDGRSFFGTSYELAKSFGLDIVKTSKLGCDNRRCHAGWYVDGNPPHPVGRGAKFANHAPKAGSYGLKAVALIHRDGRHFVGTAAEAVRTLSLSASAISNVVARRRAHTQGWRLAA